MGAHAGGIFRAPKIKGKYMLVITGEFNQIADSSKPTKVFDNLVSIGWPLKPDGAPEPFSSHNS